MAKILITGGAGFIGSYLAEALLKDNEITIYDNFHRNALKYSPILKNSKIKLIKADILDPKTLAEAVDDCSVVFHAAAIAGVENVINTPLKTLEINLMGTYNLLHAINGRSKRIEKFVFFSTSEVYGPYVYQAQEDSMTTQGKVSQQRWAYSTSKIAGEHWAYAYFKQYKLPIVIIRPFNVYGPRQVGESAVHKFTIEAIQNKPIEIYGSGNQIRAWCYIDDMIEGTLLALRNPRSTGEVYNIGNPEGTITVLELAKKIKKIANSSSRIIFKKRDYPDIELRVPSIIKAREELNYNPKVDLDEGLRKTINWWRRVGKKGLE